MGFESDEVLFIGEDQRRQTVRADELGREGGGSVYREADVSIED